MSAPTGELERIDAQVRELKQAGALDEAGLLEITDILSEITGAVPDGRAHPREQIEALKAQG